MRETVIYSRNYKRGMLGRVFTYNKGKFYCNVYSLTLKVGTKGIWDELFYIGWN